MDFLPTETGLDVETGREQFVSQGHQDQFIAEMAQWGMPRDRKFKVAGNDYTFEHFINHSRARTFAQIQSNVESVRLHGRSE